MLLVLYMYIYKYMQIQSIHLSQSNMSLDPKPSDLHLFLLVDRSSLEPALTPMCICKRVWRHTNLQRVKEHAPDLSTLPCSESSTWTCQGTTTGVLVYPQPYDWTASSDVAGLSLDQATWQDT